MDPAAHLPVICAAEERATPHLPVLIIHPEFDGGNPGKVIRSNVCPEATCSVRESDPYVPEDVDAPLLDPRPDILNRPLLVPDPFLAAFSALEAVLEFRER